MLEDAGLASEDLSVLPHRCFVIWSPCASASHEQAITTLVLTMAARPLRLGFLRAVGCEVDPRPKGAKVSSERWSESPS
jgi:hypothetical protein